MTTRVPDAARSEEAGGWRSPSVNIASGNRLEERLEVWDLGTGVWVTRGITAFEYENLCFVKKTTQGEGATASVTELAYDCNGNLELVWDANHPSATSGPTQIHKYDVLDRLVEVRQPWEPSGAPCSASDASGCAVTVYGYDVQDHLTSVTDAEGNLTTYVFGDRDLLIQETSPVTASTTHRYGDHGQLASTTDARSIEVSRIVDALDRVTSVDYLDNTLDATYTYDDPATNALGRLSSISRDGATVSYAYDGLGRLVQDGQLGLSYDENGNVDAVTYPGGVIANYGYDFADRPSTLDVDDGTGPQSIVVSAGYEPSGPLSSLVFANGVEEARSFDIRYFPSSIGVASLEDHFWDYTTDGVGNVTRIEETEGCVDQITLSNRTFSGVETVSACQSISAGPAVTVASGADLLLQAAESITLNGGFSVELGAELSVQIGSPAPTTTTIDYGYQDVHYFLTSADGGVWGDLAWTYDEIGNRLTETAVPPGMSAGTDEYIYAGNGSGNTPILDLVRNPPGGGVLKDFTYGPAGHLTQVDVSGNVVSFGDDQAGRVSSFSRVGGEHTSLLYDGRSFLRRAETLLSVPDVGFVEPTYGSDGRVMSLRRQPSPIAPEERVSFFYLADRPVAQLRQISGTSEWLYLSTDHLGTVVLATESGMKERWHGPLEPFGGDPARRTSESAAAKGLFLRFPGQWEDPLWADSFSGTEVVYNVHRWFMTDTGRYTRPDPIGISDSVDEDSGALNLYLYTVARPTLYRDPLGLLSVPWDSFEDPRCRDKWQNKVLPRLQKTAAKRRCKTFFCEKFGVDLETFINGPEPQLLFEDPVNPRALGSVTCLEDDPASTPIKIKPEAACGSPRRLTRVILHELGHYADCAFGGPRGRYDDERDGCGAEFACFGSSIKCPSDPWLGRDRD